MTPPTELYAAFGQILEPHGLLAWLATYLLHSTLLLGAVWAVSRGLRGRNLRLEEGLWKAALVGSLLTATVQTGVAALPAGDAFAEGAVAPVATVVTAAPAAWPSTMPAVPGAGASRPDPRLGELASVLPGWQRLALAGWLAGAVLSCALLTLAWLRLRLRLRGRREVSHGTAPRLLERLLERTARRRRVRLTGAGRLPVPIALGVGEREICLPHRALRELDERRQEALLAHELAHLERRDPAWLLAALALQGLLFVQPLNRLARRRLEEIAELRCDAWAVRATGDRVGLASCLTEVAGWLVAGRSALPVPGMARRGGNLTARVERILTDAGTGGGAGPTHGRRWLAAAAVTALLGGALLVPGLAPALFAVPETDAGAPSSAVEPATPPAEEVEAREAPETDADRERERDIHRDRDADHDHAFDFHLDLSSMPDPEEISRLASEAMAAARASMPGPEEMAEIEEQAREAMEQAMEARHLAFEAQQEALEEMGRALELELEGLDADRELTAAEKARIREQIHHEMAAARDEMERALAAVGPALQEMEGMEELERLNREIREEMAVEMDRARHELERAERQVRREVEREVRVERQEVRREVERELAEARRELEQTRRELEAERRELERERRRLERERETETLPPPPLR